jgi:hypothetical protein
MIKVYIASPYTLGDVAVNVKAQLDTFAELLDLGYIPFAPLLSHFVHMAHPRPYHRWTAYDEEWVKACDVVLRLPGESKGADNEVRLAESLNIPVVRSVLELLHKHPACP